VQTPHLPDDENKYKDEDQHDSDDELKSVSDDSLSLDDDDSGDDEEKLSVESEDDRLGWLDKKNNAKKKSIRKEKKFGSTQGESMISFSSPAAKSINEESNKENNPNDVNSATRPRNALEELVQAKERINFKTDLKAAFSSHSKNKLAFTPGTVTSGVTLLEEENGGNDDLDTREQTKLNDFQELLETSSIEDDENSDIEREKLQEKRTKNLGEFFPTIGGWTRGGQCKKINIGNLRAPLPKDHYKLRGPTDLDVIKAVVEFTIDEYIDELEAKGKDRLVPFFDQFLYEINGELDVYRNLSERYIETRMESRKLNVTLHNRRKELAACQKTKMEKEKLLSIQESTLAKLKTALKLEGVASSYIQSVLDKA